MRRIILSVLCVSLLGAAGCATSAELEQKARVHQMRADAAASVRDYDRASDEEAKAAHLHEKAVKRAYKEGISSQVVLPPAPPPVYAP